MVSGLGRDLGNLRGEGLPIAEAAKPLLDAWIGEHVLAETVERIRHRVIMLDTTRAGRHDPIVAEMPGSEEGSRRRGFSRAGFLKAGAVAAATVGGGSLAQAAAAGANRDALAYLRLATYRPLVNSTFTLYHSHAPLQSKLVELTNLPARGRRERARREAFSLIFEVPRAEPLPQGTYQFEHETMGSFSLFLVPVGRGAKGFFLEAVINRWLDDKHP